MSSHERAAVEHRIEPGSDRSFGFIVGGVLVAIGVYLYFSGSGVFVWTLAPGILLVAFGLIAPKVLHPLNMGWTWLGIALGKIITPIVMLLVFVISVLPMGLLVRAMGKDLLGLKRKPSGSSYWIERSPAGPTPESLKDQF